MITPEMVMDWTIWVYLLTIIVCIYGTGLFGWWAHKVGNPSAVFLYVMGIFIGVGYANAVGLGHRIVDLYIHTDLNDSMRRTWWWATRTVPLTIILITLCVHMSIRIFSRRERANNKFRRDGD
jgi:hypothetical protein